MKGLIFTEFCDMVEDKYGVTLLQEVIDESQVESEGAYTAVGTYDYKEFHKLVNVLSARSDDNAPQIMYDFGCHAFKVFTKHYKAFFDKASGLFEFLELIENYIHPEVRKLYPDAELPHFNSNRINDLTLELVYTSKRHMSAFAHGLIACSAEYFGGDAQIDVAPDLKNKDIVRFMIQKSY